MSIFNKKQIPNYNYVTADATSIINPTVVVDLRKPKKGKKYLYVGKESVISGNYIFERESGCVSIGDRCYIGASTFISINDIHIGNDVVIAWGCTIYDHSSHSIFWDERKYDVKNYFDAIKTGQSPLDNKNWDVVKSSPITIQDKVWIGFGVTILKGVTIGEGAVIGAKSVVTKDVPAWSVVCGNPAVVVKKIERES